MADFFEKQYKCYYEVSLQTNQTLNSQLKQNGKLIEHLGETYL
jgi:predicted secreted Zn-dependent protease